MQSQYCVFQVVLISFGRVKSRFNFLFGRVKSISFHFGLRSSFFSTKKKEDETPKKKRKKKRIHTFSREKLSGSWVSYIQR